MRGGVGWRDYHEHLVDAGGGATRKRTLTSTITRSAPACRERDGPSNFNTGPSDVACGRDGALPCFVRAGPSKSNAAGFGGGGEAAFDEWRRACE